jgi:hypothetical protein
VYNLANDLYAVNSSAFALEIIKKYSPTTIDPYWKARILLLKAEGLTESESFMRLLELWTLLCRRQPAFLISNTPQHPGWGS